MTLTCKWAVGLLQLFVSDKELRDSQGRRCMQPNKLCSRWGKKKNCLCAERNCSLSWVLLLFCSEMNAHRGFWTYDIFISSDLSHSSDLPPLKKAISQWRCRSLTRSEREDWNPRHVAPLSYPNNQPLHGRRVRRHSRWFWNIVAAWQIRWNVLCTAIDQVFTQPQLCHFMHSVFSCFQED